jgi:hypothetical protein
MAVLLEHLLLGMSFQAFDLQDRLNLTQNHIFRGNEKMDAFKLQMNWNQVSFASVVGSFASIAGLL